MYGNCQEQKRKSFWREHIVEFYRLVFVTQSKRKSKKRGTAVGQNDTGQGMNTA